MISSPGPDPRHDTEVVRGARRRLVALLARGPDRRLAGVAEPWRHDADHGVGHAADDDRFARQRAIAFPALPEAGPDQRDGRGAALQFAGKEPATPRRPRAHDVEEPLRDHRHPHRLRLTGAEDGLRERRRLGHRREATRLRLPVQKVGLRHVGAAPALVANLEQLHDAVGLGVWQGPQQHAVDDAEHCRGGADAQADREDRGHRERRHPGQGPAGDAQIATEVAQPGAAQLVPRRLAHLRGAAELQAGRAECVLRRHPGGDVLRRLLLDVEGDLFGDAVVPASHGAPKLRLRAAPDRWRATAAATTRARARRAGGRPRSACNSARGGCWR